MSLGAADRIRAALNRLAGDMPILGIAISGGGDSTALLHIAADWARDRTLMAATVDHGLRPDSAVEAKQAGEAATALGIPHVVLRWTRETEAGNLMAEARDARLRLLSGWAQRNNLPAVLLGHTRDDVAETLMMRLARGAGIDGLAEMAEWRDAFGLRWIRPMLGVGRAELREWMQARDIGWIDDPSNQNTDFERVRVRKAMADLGVDTMALAKVAANLSEARDALALYAAEICRDARATRGTLILPRGPIRRAPAEIRRRIVVAACRWITGADYPPRRAAVSHALNGLAGGSRVTLDGAMLEPDGERLHVIREPAAAMRAPSVDGASPVWDNRWRIEGLEAGQEVSAVGLEDLVRLPWRNAGLDRDEAAGTPAIRENGKLVAAPLLQAGSRVTCLPSRDIADFQTMLVRH
ncbi:tRNA lysidine(34) synthetase TilS [Paracoccus sp. TK19116]|uniref:tRNA(Ile)-lysidine synthase n=1 Tax=Paracoccus albicereus TaxID=2922394 RepID=A0ABT1MS37_9RHOB|nr:tRNA lysidine(34) synthetase TilS [Paracoccus albicereus]MCQ0970549.1 tRNA lysidine(34) synthetase TilS [Paracoccus albicereus]